MKRINLNLDTPSVEDSDGNNNNFLDKEVYDAETNLNIRYVADIDSIGGPPPRFNPDTRTYFKCSIYSPSNRLYTVQEEVNSTQSDAGAGEPSSLLNSGGLRKSSNHRQHYHGGIHSSGGPGKLQIRNSGTIIPFPERILDVEFGRGNHQIDEEDENEDETGNVSETQSLNGCTTIRVEKHQEKTAQGAQSSMLSSAGGHTRTNSSKAQSLKGSIILQKPALSSQFSSVVGQHLNVSQLDKRITQIKPFRETFNGSLPSSNESRETITDQNGRRAGNQIMAKHEYQLQRDIDQYIHQMPGSFVCTGGTEFHHDATPVVSSAIRLSDHQRQVAEKNAALSLTPESSIQHIQIFSAQKSQDHPCNATVIQHSTSSGRVDGGGLSVNNREESKSSMPFSPHNMNEDSSIHSPTTYVFEESTNRERGGAAAEITQQLSKASIKVYSKENLLEAVPAESHLSLKKGIPIKGVVQEKSNRPPQLKRNFSPFKVQKFVGENGTMSLKGSAVAQSRFTAELTKKRVRPTY